MPIDNKVFEPYTINFNMPLTDDDWEKLFKDDDFEHVEHIRFHTKNGKKVHFYKNKTVEAIPIERLRIWFMLNILPLYDDYIHTKTYPHNETMEDIYSKGHKEGWNACLKAIKEEFDYLEKENGSEGEEKNVL